MLWVDKYRPLSLAKLDFHDDLTDRLLGLAKDGDLPHLLVYGPSGAGKKTRITALLREMFGPGVEKRRLEHRSFKTPSNKTIELTTIASNYHIEMNAADAGIYDRIIVQDVIKEIAASNPLHKVSSLPTSFTACASVPRRNTFTRPHPLSCGSQGEGQIGFKVVVLMEVDRLTKQAQAALRRTMEK